jgi:hypothetical protein
MMVFYCIGVYGPRLEEYLMEKKGEKILKIFSDRQIAYETAAKQDYFGGKTPEETIALYRKALVAGNIEQASKYSRVDLQEKKIANLKQALKENGNLDYSITYVDSVLKNSKKGCNSVGDGCAYSYDFWLSSGKPVLDSERSKIASSSEQVVGSKLLDLNLNPYTKVWKFVF